MWHREFTDRLLSIFRSDHPDLLVFDGTVIYSGIGDACRAARVPLVWVRRGLWKESVDRSQYSAPRLYSDHLIVPSDVGEVVKEINNSSSADIIDPIVIVPKTDLCSRDAALEFFGLDPELRYCLVQVGSSVVAGVDDLPSYISHRLTGLTVRVSPVVFESPVATATSDGDVVVIKGVYPLAKYLSAFDFAVVAGGYNTVHECLEMGLPALYIPKTDTITDDQVRRVENVRRLGLGLVARSRSDIDAGIQVLADPRLRESIAENLSTLPEFGGAREAALVIRRFLTDVAFSKGLLEDR